MKPILNPASEKQILATVANMPQSLLVTGDSGVGLSTIGRYIGELVGAQLTTILPEKDEKVDTEKGVISIDIMRRLYNDTRTKSAKDRVIIIDYAETMTIQAQNAFLKLLEEPGQGIHFILVSSSVTKLLPTILSRVKTIEIKPITTKQSEKLLDSLNIDEKTKRSQILFMADGLPAEITRLVSDDEYFVKQSGVMRDAREILQGSLYQKLRIAQKYKDDRNSALKLLLDATKILNHSITTNPNANTISRIDAVLQAYEQIEANGNIRLSIAKMVL